MSFIDSESLVLPVIMIFTLWRSDPPVDKIRNGSPGAGFFGKSRSDTEDISSTEFVISFFILEELAGP
jgi:hypothetical protein